MMLKGAMAEPSAGNQQPLEFYVVKNKETIEKLSKTSTYASCCASAPLTFVACYRINCRMPELLNRKLYPSDDCKLYYPI